MKRTISALVFFSLTLPASAQGVDPLIGTWKMNLEKSTVVGIPPLRSATLTWSYDGQTLIDTSEGVDAQGQPFKNIVRHIYDGMPHPSTGSPDFDQTAYTRIGNTINWVRFKNSKTVEVGQAVIIPGKTYTLHTEGVTASGQPYHAVGVYDRQ
jgi:hypothetical protein